MSKGWDNATLKKLKALVGKGLSTSEIGKRLGLSKNAVVGKLNRLGWNAKASASSAATKTAKKTTAAPTKKATPKATPKKTTAPKVVSKTKAPAKKAVAKKPAAKVVKKAAEKEPVAKETKSSKSSSKNLAMHQRIIQHSLEMANLKPNQCRWPIGDPDSENFHFCGKQVFTGKPYCYEHCRLAYQFTPPKKK